MISPKKSAFTTVVVSAVWLLASTAQGAIVYTSPAIPINVAPDDPAILLDFDAFGSTDVSFTNNGRDIRAFLVGDNRLIIGPAPHPTSTFAAALPAGFTIGPTLATGFDWLGERGTLNGCVSAGGFICRGNFFGGGERIGTDFLGVEFDIAGQIHYGWVEILSFSFFFHAELVRWAYETEPGVPIRAGAIPEPATGSLLLFGLLAAACRRRR